MRACRPVCGGRRGQAAAACGGAQAGEDRVAVERQHAQLGRRALEERAEHEQLVGVLGLERRALARAPRDASASRPSTPSRVSPRRGEHAAARDEEAVARAGLERGREHARLQPPQPVEPRELVDHPLQRRDAVAQPRGVLVAQAVGEVGEALVEPHERRALEQVVELLLRAAAERPRGALGVRACAAAARRPTAGGVTTTSSPRRRR